MLSTATRTTATVNPLTPSPLNGALVPSGSPATSSALSAQAAPSSSFAAALRKLAKQAEEPRGKAPAARGARPGGCPGTPCCCALAWRHRWHCHPSPSPLLCLALLPLCLSFLSPGPLGWAWGWPECPTVAEAPPGAQVALAQSAGALAQVCPSPRGVEQVFLGTLGSRAEAWLWWHLGWDRPRDLEPVLVLPGSRLWRGHRRWRALME